MADTRLYVSVAPARLTDGVAAGATTANLSAIEDIYGNTLTMSDFGSVGYWVSNPGKTTQQQGVFTGISSNQITGVSWTTAKSPYTQTSGFKAAIAAGVRIIISNTPAFYDEFLNKGNDETVRGLITFTQSPVVPTPVDPTDAANKAYADAIANAGAATATEEVKGISELSTEDEMPYGFNAKRDLSTVAFNQGLSVASIGHDPQGVFFRPDGLKMYLVGNGVAEKVHEYNLSTAWDISTAVLLQSLTITGDESSATALWFKTDGKKMYVAGQSTGEVHEYNLSTAWDVSSATLGQSEDVSAKEDTPYGLSFKPDGTKMYVSGWSSQAVNEYALSTPWDVSSATWTDEFSTMPENAYPGHFISNDGLKMFVADWGSNDLHEYDLATAWDVSTAVFNQTLDIGVTTSEPTGLFISPDGSKMYISNTDDTEVNEYDFTTPIVARPGTLMGAIQAGHHFTAADAGSTDSYHIRLNPPLKALRTSQMFCFIANTANNGACELDIDGTGYKAIKKYVSGAKGDLVTGDIIASMPVIVAYDGTHFVMLNPGGTMPSTALLSEMKAILDATDITGAELEDLSDNGITTIHNHGPKVVSSTRDLSTASGNQSIAHGLGATPKWVRITTLTSNATGTETSECVGVWDGTNTRSVWKQHDNGTDTVGVDSTSIVKVLAPSGDPDQLASVTVDGTNVTLAWTKAGSATGTAYMIIEVGV